MIKIIVIFISFSGLLTAWAMNTKPMTMDFPVGYYKKCYVACSNEGGAIDSLKYENMIFCKCRDGVTKEISFIK